jgi:hypothetical protein
VNRTKFSYYLVRWGTIPELERKLLIKGLFLSLIFPVLVKVLGIKSIKVLFKNKQLKNLNEFEPEMKIQILKKTLSRIKSLTPWKSNCLIKSLTFKCLANYLELDCYISFELMISPYGRLIAHSVIKRSNNIIFLKLNKFEGQEILNIH